ncbi:hypothetical protein [Natronoflexus pectinivorans]|uniref:Uncharacterized protein n=1 Tax=Natronoflexus pectinivorans TaxID=682526 RepID=A0A4V2RWH4_9BACT|nr:hypothetical protein [Natronoflexus pectinivorans]TCO08426.1 hypothetical protein EV194_105234 [Natronoflexus pectinivorans]
MENQQEPLAYAQESQNVSVGEWVLSLLIVMIPLIGLIMLFVWAFGGNTKVSKANFAKAALIWYAIGIVLWILIAGIFGAAFLFGR